MCFEAAVKIDLEKVLSGDMPVILELGCGSCKQQGRIGIDKLDLPGVDIVANLEDGLPFLPDRSVDTVYCRSILEHLHNFERIVREIMRVLKPSGKAIVFVPHFSNPYFYSDFTHVRFFGLYTFQYFVDSRNQLVRKVPSFYTDVKLTILSQKLVFSSPFRLRSYLKRFFGLLVNAHPRLQEFYEEILCYVVPCYGIETVIAPMGATKICHDD